MEGMKANCVNDCSGWYNNRDKATVCEQCGEGRFNNATGMTVLAHHSALPAGICGSWS